MTVQFTGATNTDGNRLVFDTRAHEYDDGKFQGFVHLILFRDSSQEEKDFPCGAIRDTEEEALADALKLSKELPISRGSAIGKV
ncbi:MAG: hypothetical protein JWP38_1017 [Herbaspirillum sp.]|jgi:hypothetical protein|nr:hypothetical protein [Herbaspirillum sp.]